MKRLPRVDFVGHLLEAHQRSRAGRVFDTQAVAVELVVALEGFEQQLIQGKSDGPAPVGVAAEQAAVGIDLRK